MFPLLSSSLILSLAVFAPEVLAKCECGFSVNTQSGAQLYTEALETDFLHFANFIDNKGATGWVRQAYETPSRYEGAVGKYATLNNVVPNPLKKAKDWSGDSNLGGDAGLNMWVNRTLVEGKVSMAEIASARRDMLYGSYRVAMKPTGTPGTCTGFFWYHNDSQEIDFEFLSREYNSTSTPVNLVLQSPQSVSSGYDASRTRSFSTHQLPFAPSAGVHEYRFDWAPGSVAFLADGALLQHMRGDGVPSNPGWLMLNHWSNGDEKWSGGPPQADAKNVVSYVKAYFNSSEPERQQAFVKRCGAFDAEKVCVVPDQVVPPDPRGASSSSSSELGRTEGGDEDKEEGGGKGGKDGGASEHPAKTTFFTEQPGAADGTGKDFAASGAAVFDVRLVACVLWTALSALVVSVA